MHPSQMFRNTNTQLKTPTQYSAGAQYQDPIHLNKGGGVEVVLLSYVAMK